MASRRRHTKKAPAMQSEAGHALSKPAGPSKKPISKAPTGSPHVVFLVAQMLFCLVGINLCFGWWSVKQERVIKQPYIIAVENDADEGGAATAPHTEKIFLATTYGITLAQNLTGFLISAALLTAHSLARTLARRLRRPLGVSAAAAIEDSVRPSRLTLRDVPELLAMGFSNLFGSSLGYAAMRRLSYPISLTAKMCKMLPVMFVGSVWYHTRYPTRKVLSCLFITSGVIAFALLDQRPSGSKKNAKATATAQSSSSLFGLVLMVINLLMDGFTNSTQDVLVKRHRWGGVSLMMWTNLLSVICALFVLSVLECGEQPWTWLCTFADHVLSSVRGSSDLARSGSETPASLSFLPFHDLSYFLTFLARCEEGRRDVLLMAVLNALGQLFIFHTISVFGTLAVTAMTLLRKAGSVLLSIYVHGHPVQSPQWAALTIIFIGILSEGYINVQDASKRQRQKQQPQQQQTAQAPSSSLPPLPQSKSKGASATPKPKITSGRVVSPPTKPNGSTKTLTGSRSTTA